MLRESAKKNGKWKGHDLGDQEGQEKPCGVEPQCRAISGCHINNGIDPVDVEEKRQKKDKGFLLVAHIFEGMA